MKKEVKGFLALLASTFFYGFMGIFSRFISFQIPVFYQLSLRNLVAAAVFIVLVILTKKWNPVKRSDWIWYISRGLAGVLAFAFFYVAVNFIPIGACLLIFYAGSTIGGYAIGSFMFKEKLTKVKIASFILSIIGLFFIYSFSFEQDKIIYFLLSLFSGLLTAVWSTFSKKISDRYSNDQLNFIDSLLGFLIGMVFSVALKEQWQLPQLNFVWLLMIPFSLNLVITAKLIIYGFSKLQAQIGSLVMLTEVLFAILFGFLFFKEIPTAWSLVGGSLIIVAIILPELKLKKLFKS